MSHVDWAAAALIAGGAIAGGLAGALAEHWHVVDQLNQLQQLGVLPMPAAAS